MKFSHLLLSLCIASYSFSSAAKEISEFAKKIACSVSLPDGQSEKLELVADMATELKLFSLAFIITQNQNGAFAINVLKDTKAFDEAFLALIMREVNNSWISPNLLSYSPELIQKLYASDKARSAAEYIFMAEARIYSSQYYDNGTVKLFLKDVLHSDYFKDVPNHKAELKMKDALKLSGPLKVVTASGKSRRVQVDLICEIAK